MNKQRRVVTWRDRRKAELELAIVDISLAARRLRQHSTVRGNQTLRAEVEEIDAAAHRAGMLTSILWLRGQPDQAPSQTEAA